MDRNLAHAALARGGILDREDFTQAAHDIVDNLCDVIDAVAAQAAAQELQHQRRARGLTPCPSTSPPPSNESESERLQERQTLALESIAKSFAKFNARGEP